MKVLKNKEIPNIKTSLVKYYDYIVEKANLASYSPSKGNMYILPYGEKIWSNIRKIFNSYIEKLDVENVMFPLLIPQKLFEVEKTHIQGFNPECAIVTELGNKKLSEKLVIRPTSEVLFADFFKKTLHSYSQLPILLNQWCNVFRYEKNTRPFLRTREFFWQEGHTLHQNNKNSLSFTKKIWKLYIKFFKKNLLLEPVIGKKSNLEKFAGAFNTFTLETLTLNNNVLQLATSHNLGDTFSKVFDIKYTNKENKVVHAFQSSWGLSTRTIGAIILCHSDQKGLVLPPDIAPILISICLINNKDIELFKYYKKIKKLFYNFKFYKRIKLYKKNIRFSQKLFDTEIQGIPIRFEIGKKENISNTVIVYRRDLESKKTIELSKLKVYIKELIKSYKANIFNKNKNNLLKNIFIVKNDFKKESLKTFISQRKYGFFLINFCNNVECEKKIKIEYIFTPRAIKLPLKKNKINCYFCKKKYSYKTYFGVSY